MPAEHGAVRELLEDALRRRDVGRQHELLHHGIGLPHHLGLNVDRVGSLAVDVKADLGRCQNQGSVLHAATLEDFGQPQQVAEADRQGVVVLRVVNLVLGHLIGHGGAGLDDALVELGGEDLCVLGHVPDAREGEPLHTSPERTQVGGEQLWHHVDSPERKHRVDKKIPEFF